MFRVDIKYPTRSDRNYWFYSRSYNFLILYNRFKRYFIIPVFLFHLLICIIILKTKQAHTHRTTYQSIYTIWQVRRRIKKRRKDRAFKSFLPSNIKPIISKFISLFKYRFPRILGSIQDYHFFRSNPHQSQQTNSLSISTLLLSHTYTRTPQRPSLPIFTWNVLATR